jgi:hypothetical protein
VRAFVEVQPAVWHRSLSGQRRKDSPPTA